MLSGKNIKVLFIVFISLLSAYLFFYKLGAAPVELWDENTNIKVVNSTLSSSDRRSLQIDDEAFYEKPPVWYYLTEVLVSVFGESRYVYRLISAISGLVISICIFLIVNKRYSPLSAFIASLSFLAVGQNIVTNASGYFSSHTFRSADLDPLQIALMVLSVLFLLNIDKSKNYFYLLATALSIAFMVKGPIVFIPSLVVAYYIFTKKSEFGLGRKDIYKVIAIAISIIIPWHLYMYMTHGREFIDAYLGYHIIERSLVAIEEHDEWRFFYFEVFYNLKVNILAGLASLSVIYLLIVERKSEIFRISLAIIIGIFTIITLMDTKLAWYILPV